MGKRMKSYLVFTGLGYRIFVLAVIPLALMISGLLLSVILDFPGYLLAIYLLPSIEIMADAFVFEGIASKEIVRLEYLKTSKNGNELMKYALQGGMIRMLISNAVILGVNYLGYHAPKGDSWDTKRLLLMLFFLLVMYTVSMLLIVIARFFANVQVNYALGFVGLILQILAFMLTKKIYAAIMIAFVLAVIISVFSVKIVEKRIKESYYDKTVTDGV